jgi:hypothetical protein
MAQGSPSRNRPQDFKGFGNDYDDGGRWTAWARPRHYCCLITRGNYSDEVGTCKDEVDRFGLQDRDKLCADMADTQFGSSRRGVYHRAREGPCDKIEECQKLRNLKKPAAISAGGSTSTANATARSTPSPSAAPTRGGR